MVEDVFEHQFINQLMGTHISYVVNDILQYLKDDPNKNQEIPKFYQKYLADKQIKYAIFNQN